MGNDIKNKVVMVTGACGTIGSEIVRILLTEFEIGSLICVDSNESELVFLEEKFAGNSKVKFFLGDIRDYDSIHSHTVGVDIIYHTAALKHVFVCERTPMEAVRTNVHGLQNVIAAATANRVARVVFTSSDKAVNPTNVMGTSKLMGERLMTAASTDQSPNRPIFISTRFGNVLGSRGSVMPIFRDQIRRGGPLTLTSRDMTRFIMSLEQAVRLVIESTFIGRSGDVMITKMPTIRILDLATVMIDHYAPIFGHSPSNIEIKLIGPKPGEKMFEELMNSEETRRAIELPNYFVVRPPFNTSDRDSTSYGTIEKWSVDKPYHSANEKHLTVSELSQFLAMNDLLECGSGQRVHGNDS